MSSDLIQVDLDRVEYNKTLDSLNALSVDLQDKAIKSALRVSAKPLQAAMKRNAPDDRSTAGSRLERAVNITQAKTGSRVKTGAGIRSVSLNSGEFGIVVGPNKKVGGKSMGGLGMLLEGGAKAHKISAKNNVLKLGPKWIRGSINHPGIKAMNWMSGALSSASATIENQFYFGLDKWISKNGR